MKSSNKFFILVGLLILSLFSLYLIRSLYQILALSVIVAYFTFPLKKFFKKYINNDVFASLLSMISGSFILLIIIFFVVSSIYSGLMGITSFASDAKNVYLLNETASVLLSYNLQQPLTEAGINQIASSIQNLIFSVPQMLVNVLVFIFLLYYFIKYGDELINIMRGIIPPTEMKYFDKFIKKLNSLMRTIFRGQFITALIESTILFFFITFLGIPYAFELSFFTFLMCFFGITSAIVPVGLNIFFLYHGIITGDYLTFIITLLFTGFITITDDIIKPLIGHKAGFNPVFFVLGLITGGLTLGFTGFIIGPLIYGMLQSSLEIYFEDKNVKFA